MKRKIVCGILFAALVSGCLAQSTSQAYKPVRVYDPKRDAARDLREAELEARRTGRNVLIEAGGKWCSWCKILHDFFRAHADIRRFRDDNYVVVYLNFSEENKNERVFRQFGPLPETFPHLYVLSSDGKLLVSQETSILEAKRSYDPAKMREFLRHWSPIEQAAHK